jgi:hypothetical protein
MPRPEAEKTGICPEVQQFLAAQEERIENRRYEPDLLV